MSFITYPQINGQVAVVIPADYSLSIEAIAEKDVPKGVPYKIVDSLDIDNDYFNAYEYHPENGAEININKAKAIHLDKFRSARKPKLESLDIEYMRALESNDISKLSEIAIKKQKLRDITKITLPNTISEMKSIWPRILE
jgi:hypothetical protein